LPHLRESLIPCDLLQSPLWRAFYWSICAINCTDGLRFGSHYDFLIGANNTQVFSRRISGSAPGARRTTRQSLATALRIVTRGCSAAHQRSPTPCNTRNDSLRVRFPSRWPTLLEALPVDLLIRIVHNRRSDGAREDERGIRQALGEHHAILTPRRPTRVRPDCREAVAPKGRAHLLEPKY
jgi:hypothetical protein